MYVWNVSSTAFYLATIQTVKMEILRKGQRDSANVGSLIALLLWTLIRHNVKSFTNKH